MWVDVAGRNHGCVGVRWDGMAEKYACDDGSVVFVVAVVDVSVVFVVAVDVSVGRGVNNPWSSLPSSALRRSSRFPLPPSRLL